MKKNIFPLCTWGCEFDSYVSCENKNHPVFMSKESENDHCLNNLSFTLKDKDSNVIGSGENVNFNEIMGNSPSNTQAEKKNKQGNLILHKNTLAEWFSDWSEGINLWDEIMGID